MGTRVPSGVCVKIELVLKKCGIWWPGWVLHLTAPTDEYSCRYSSAKILIAFRMSMLSRSGNALEGRWRSSFSQITVWMMSTR